MSKLILIVEDEPSIVVALKFLMEQEGYRTLVAVDGAQALALAARLRPSLIILDVMLPRMDGLEVCRIVRSSPALQATPVVLVTANSGHADAAAAVGANAYVTKPFSTDELARIVREELAKAG